MNKKIKIFGKPILNKVIKAYQISVNVSFNNDLMHFAYIYDLLPNETIWYELRPEKYFLDDLLQELKKKHDYLFNDGAKVFLQVNCINVLV